MINNCIRKFVLTDDNGVSYYIGGPRTAGHDGEPRLRVLVNMPNGNVWHCGTVVKNEYGEWTVGVTYYEEWRHMEGNAQKQPKNNVREPVNAFVDNSLELCSVFKDACDEVWEQFEATSGDAAVRLANAQNEAYELRKKLAAAEAERDEARADNNPSFDQLVMRTLIDSLKPALQSEAKKMAEDVMEHGSLPTVMRVEVADKVTTMQGLFHEKFETVVTMVANGENVFLTGDAGTGKNVLGEQVAEALGIPFHYMPQVCDKYTDVVGFADANGRHHETPLIRAARDGGLLFVDEIDASIPETLVAINALLANGYMVTGWGETIKSHEDFRCIAAGNTIGTGADSTYTGRYALDGATLNRFDMVHIDYDSRVENGIAGEEYRYVADFNRGVRKAVREVGMDFPVSYRATKSMAKLLAAGLDVETVLDCALFKQLHDDDRRVIINKVRGYGILSDNELFRAAWQKWGEC